MQLVNYSALKRTEGNSCQNTNKIQKLENSISLNKFISDTGYCSRREADQLISEGRVLLNNKVARAGNRYTPGDEVVVDGSIVQRAKKEKPVYLLLNKPVGITTTTELHVPGNIIRFINYPKRIFPVGRLDKDSEGLILLTNDGDIVNKILRAEHAHEKEYHVRLNKPIAPGFAQTMSAGVPILGTTTLPCKVTVTGRKSFSIVLMQGLNRQIRRMCEYLGYEVESLQRVRIMHLRLDKLPAGKWRYLSDAELNQLQKDISQPVQKPDSKPVKPEPAATVRKKPADKPKPVQQRDQKRGKENNPEKKKKTSGYKEFRQRRNKNT